MAKDKLSRDQIDEKIVALFDKVGIKPRTPLSPGFWDKVDEVRKKGFIQECKWLVRYGKMWQLRRYKN